MQKKIKSTQIIDSLAEMTRHQDREIIEKSLLKTIHELMPSLELRLFKVKEGHDTNNFSLHLLSYAVGDNINVMDVKVDYKKMSPSLQSGIIDAIQQEDLQQVSDNDKQFIIYPVSNTDNQVFALLLQEYDTIHSLDAPRYTYGLLKIYSNYLDLLRITQTDKLTGVLNRETLDTEITRALIKNNVNQEACANKRKEDANSYWLGLLDIDHFKSINDQFGHLFGDEVLILIARTMENLLRDHDSVFRFGGEEFVILLNACGMQEAHGAFERIRRYIEDYQFPKMDTLTVSIGVTKIDTQSSASAIIGEADIALYYAKEHGRNKTFIYEELLQQGLISQQATGTVVDDIELF